jgi:ribosomal-protein-alanine N-acetyltransferase
MTPDPDSLAAIHRDAFTFPRPWSATELAGLLADPSCFCAVAPDGFALGRTVADEAELLTIAVRPAARRAGVGATLLAAVLAIARRRGAARMFLEVAATNQAAIRLYDRVGFLPVGTRRGYFSDGTARVDALVLSRDLGPADR